MKDSGCRRAREGRMPRTLFAGGARITNDRRDKDHHTDAMGVAEFIPAVTDARSLSLVLAVSASVAWNCQKASLASPTRRFEVLYWKRLL